MFVPLTILTANTLVSALKRATDRPRPFVPFPDPPPLVEPPLDLSFPSGHAATGFAAATILARYHRGAAPVLYALAAAIAFSRVYVGVHYPLDVLAGAALGVVVATALLLLAAVLRRRLPAPQPG